MNWQEVEQKIHDLRQKFPMMVTRGATEQEIVSLQRALGQSLPPQYVLFLKACAGGTIGCYPIFGLLVSETMGVSDFLIEMNLYYHGQYPDIVCDWIIISVDHAGNPFGIVPDGSISIYDHDAHMEYQIAPDLASFILQECFREARPLGPRPF